MKYRLGYSVYGEGLSQPNPANIAQGLMFWTKGQNLSRDQWNTAGYQLNNEVDTLPPKVEYRGLSLTGLNVDSIDFSSVSEITGFRFKVRVADRTSSGILFNVNGTVNFTVGSSNDFDFASLEGGGFYIDGVDEGNFNTVPIENDTWYDVLFLTNSTISVTSMDLSASGGSSIQVKDLTIFNDTSLSFATADVFRITTGQELVETLAKESYVAGCYPLADYHPTDGARTAGDRIVDYSGNANDATAQGSSVTPVFTSSFGYQVSEDNYNISTELYLYGVGNGNDIDGTPIAAFTGAAAPDVQLFTGGGISCTAANLDHVVTPNYSDSNLTFSFWVDVSSLTAFEYYLGGNATGSYLTYLGSGEWRIRFASSLMNFSGFSTSGWHMISFTADDTTVTMYEDGVEIDSLARAGTLTSFNYLARRASDYSSIDFTDTFISSTIWTQPQLLELYNNPNKFVDICRADAGMFYAYDFNQGAYPDGAPVIDVSGSGNHGVVSAGAGDIAVNNLEIGSQTALHGWNVYDKFTDVGLVPYGINLSYIPEIESDQSWTIRGRALWDGDAQTHKNLFDNGLNANSEFVTIGMRGNNFTVNHHDNASTFTNLIGRFVSITGYENKWFDFVVTYDGSATSGGYTITLTFDDGTILTDTNDVTAEVRGYQTGSASISNGDINGREWTGFIAYIQIDGLHRWEQGTGWVDSIGSNDGTPVNSPLYQIIMPAISDTGTTDIQGITVARPWKVGLLNFAGLISTSQMRIPYVAGIKSRTNAYFIMQVGKTSTTAFVLDGRNGGPGINILSNTNDINLQIEDDSGGAQTTAALTNLLSGLGEGGVSVFCANVSPNGFVEGYAGDDDEAMVFVISDSSEDVGITGSDSIDFGKSSLGNFDIAIVPLIFHKQLTLAEQEKLKTYVLKSNPL